MNSLKDIGLVPNLATRAELTDRTQNVVEDRHNGGTQGATQARQRKVNLSRRAIISTGLKQGQAQNIAYTGGRGAWKQWRFFPRKALHIYRYESPPGVHNKYYEALIREIRTILQ